MLTYFVNSENKQHRLARIRSWTAHPHHNNSITMEVAPAQTVAPYLKPDVTKAPNGVRRIGSFTRLELLRKQTESAA